MINIFESYRKTLKVHGMIRHTEFQVIQVTGDCLAIRFLHLRFSLRTTVPVSDITRKKSIVESKSDLLGTSI